MADVNLAPDWAQHFHDDNSNFAVGWKLYTYMSRTETYKPAYSDPAGTILHNPVITLNSRGEVPGMGLYLISGEAYTLELRDTLGVVKKTVHNVVGGGGTSGSSSSTLLPSQSVLGNITASTTIGYPVKIESDLQTASSDSNIPNVGAILNELNDYLPNSGNNIYDGNLEVTGNLEASSITINGIEIGLEGPEGPPGEDGIDGTDGVDGVSLVSIHVDETSNTGKILYNLSNDPENWIDAGDVIPDGLGQVKNDISDSLGFLPEKVAAGNGMSIYLDETNRLKFDATSMDDHKVQAHMYSTQADYAGTVLQAGAGIDISLTPDLNRLVIKATGTAVGGFYWKGVWDDVTSYNSNNAVWYFDNTVSPVVNRLYIAMEPNQGINPIEDTSGIWSEMMRVDTLGDMFVAVDETDMATGYLIDKLRSGDGIAVTKKNDGGDVYLELTSNCLYSVTIGGVTKQSTELAGNIVFSAEGGSVIAWDGNHVKISSVALGETSTTAYRGDRGKTAYDHSQVTGNPHGTDFSELENKPNTLAGYGVTDVSINDITGLQDVLNSKADDTDLDEYLPLTGGNLEGDLSIKSNTNSRLLGFVVPIDGYNSSDRNAISFRYDKNELAHARLKGYTITETGSKVFGNAVDGFFNERGSFNNLYDSNNPNNNYSIEITPPTQFTNSANTAWRIIVSFHSGAAFSNLTVDVKNGVDLWTTVYDGYPTNTKVFMHDFTLTNGGSIKSVKFTFTNITGNTYINHLGIEGLLSSLESQWYVNRTGGNVYGNINAYNLLVNNKQVATQEWTTSQDYITKTIADSSYLDSTLKGIPDGVAELDSTGRVPSNQLPSYVDDVVVVESYSSLPTTGENGKIYITLDTNLTYRWNGSGYTEISPSLALGETSTTAYRGDRGKAAYDHSQTSGNPHGTDFSELENKPTTLNGYGITDGAERYHAFFDPSFFGEGTTSLYGHVKKAQYMTIDGNDVVPSSLMYQNVVQRFHSASGGGGTAGWLNVCSLTCVGGYTNEPITITLSRRGANKTCRLTMRFQSTNTLTPYVELATYEGQDYGVYYHKRVEGTYDIYVQKSEPYDRCSLTEFKSPYNIKLNSENGTVATVPSGSIAFSRAPSDYIKTGLVTTHDWNNFTEHGVYTVDNWSGANGPTVGGIAAYKWGQLVVEQYQDKVTQIYYPHQSNMPYIRQAWGAGAWQPWKTSIPTNYGTVDSSTNWNNLTSTGKYRVLAVSGTNGPSTAYTLGVLLVDYAADDYIQQTYIPTYGNGTPVCRQRRSGTWGGWYGSISGGTGMSLNTQIHYQSVTAPRTDPNAIYLCY